MVVIVLLVIFVILIFINATMICVFIVCEEKGGAG